MTEIECRCSNCGWVGKPKCVYEPDPLNPEEVVPEMGCPNCNSSKWVTLNSYISPWRSKPGGK